MACSNIPYSLAGLDSRCKEGNVPSITEILVANYDDVSAITFSEATSAEATITMVSGKTFEQFKLAKNKGGLTSTAEIKDDGSPIFTHECTLNIARLDKEKRYKLMALFMLPTIVIVKDSNGLYHLMGDTDRDNYVEGTAYSATTGASDGDSNHYELTLSIKTASDAYFVSAANVQTLIAG